ncbi:DUF6282 family protein [Halobaculum roseum]|uniref:DUF6282 family protein n=1 Tax=Halobaculum roseum TaxID=2175149 RepID=A0ABD5MIV8_9EURY|nr:DUF6282 family protein [Halobaculum roseum]QZY04202.1 hypothetical protein K6T36_15915 [Halobaculum roseum]
MISSDSEVVERLVSGAVDTHMHTAPGAFPRHDTDFSAARSAEDHGMRAIVTKNHHFETASRAQIVREELGFEMLGGITLNEWVGGLNHHAVDGAANFDADIVWMPTITAANHLENAAVQMFETEEEEKGGISVLNDSGELTDETLTVLDRIAAHEMVIGLSHLSPTESIELVEEAVDRGVEEFLVQHPHANFLNYTHDQMRTITDLGATLEFHYICTTEMMGNAATVQDYVDAVDIVGPENAVMATDGGATANPPAIEQFKSFVAAMLDAGVSEASIETMIVDNPRRIFDLD